jgi:glutaredoxin
MSFTIYTKDDCPWCDKAKNLLRSFNLNYIEYKLGDNLLREEFIDQFGDNSTFPKIFHDDDLIGGYSDLINWFRETQ